MNHGTDPHSASPSWHQVSIQFNDYSTAEHTGITHLAPEMTSAQTAGLITSWFFIRKAPCWRLRFRPTHDSTEQDATTVLHQQLNTLQDTGRIASWVQTSYEPEMHAFGGATAMDVAHQLFHADSRHILAYFARNHAAGPAGRSDHRREVSILLCSILMRSAGQDWYEQADIWARVAEHRTLPPGTHLDRLRTMEPDLRRLMTVNPSPASPGIKDNGPLTVLSDWAAAFADAGRALSDLACNGTLRRGVRAVLAHHVIFHWNRIGLPHTTQSILAHVATAIVLGQ